MIHDKTLRTRFDAKYRVDENGCWIWTATINHSGYGMIGVGGLRGKMRPAHRVSWWLYRGEIKEGLYVLHHCDVRACVNPDHLFLGTHQDNMDDMRAKGRANYTGRPRKIT